MITWDLNFPGFFSGDGPPSAAEKLVDRNGTFLLILGPGSFCWRGGSAGAAFAVNRHETSDV